MFTQIAEPEHQAGRQAVPAPETPAEHGRRGEDGTSSGALAVDPSVHQNSELLLRGAVPAGELLFLSLSCEKDK
jgi:hypothetical protein